MKLSRRIVTEDHESFRETVRRFMAEEIIAKQEQAEADGIYDRTAWLKAGELGLLGVAMPEEYGGLGLDYTYSAVVIEEQARAGASGPGFMLHSCMVMPYILKYGSEALKSRWLPRAIRGEAVLSIGMTEPNAGSDLKAIRSTAVRDGDHYVLNGSKIFITNGISADACLVVCKTDPDAGARGISLLLVETDRPGFRKGRNLKKLGMRAQDTAELFFDDVRVPAANLVGEEGQGFAYLMEELAWERLQGSMWCVATCEGAAYKTLAYVNERRAFGKTIFDFQNTRFKLAELFTEIEIARVFVDRCLEDMVAGRLDAGIAAMAKMWTSDVQGRVMDECLQLFGGYGYMWEYDICRGFADARINRIWGGTNEIMKEIISRRLTERLAS